MKTITIITTTLDVLGGNFMDIGQIKDFPDLDRFYYPRYEDIALDDFLKNREYVKWYTGLREKLVNCTTPDPGLRAIKFSKLDDSDKNPNALEGRFMRNETWNKNVRAILINAPDYPCRKDLVKGLNRVFRYKNSNEENSINSTYILPAFKREREEKRKMEDYIEFFIEYAKKELEKTSDFHLNIALHASDFYDCEKKDLGYCIYSYEYKHENASKDRVKNIKVFLFSHVDNEFCRFLKGSSTLTSNDLFDEKYYKLHGDIDNALIESEDKETIGKRIKDQVEKFDEDDEKVKSNNPNG